MVVDAMLDARARGIWLLSDLLRFVIHIENIPGKRNVIADLLSRLIFAQFFRSVEVLFLEQMWIPTQIDLTI